MVELLFIGSLICAWISGVIYGHCIMRKSKCDCIKDKRIRKKTR